MPDIPSTLYFASAVLSAVTIPKHIFVGFKHVHRAIEKIPSDAALSLGKAIAPTGWDFGVGALGILVLMNLKWAFRGGPSSWEEKGVAWIHLLVGGYVGWTYFKIKMYSPLGFLWAAPAFSTIAMAFF